GYVYKIQEYYIGKITAKRPSKTIVVLIKLGLYCLIYINSIPKYALVNNLVTICEKYGKRQLKGFVNATLKNFDREKILLPEDELERLSVEASVPLWIVKKYVKQYGFQATDSFVRSELFTKEHIRANLRKITLEELESKLGKENVEYERSRAGGLFVRNCAVVKNLCEKGFATIQSMTSMLAAQAMEVKDGEKVLDICSAPGGKAVYMSELADVKITACDKYEHRIELIKSYVARTSAKGIEAIFNDALVYNEKFENAFDKTLCDAPCSGLGVAGKKPDIYLNSSESKIKELTEVQYGILTNAAKYTKRRLVYSTCTLLKEENGDIVDRFIKENPKWKLVSQKQYLPDGKGCDGFYIAVLEKKTADE
ncbi:MAG: hypothetical protein K2G37_04745, partial [Clostridia bacterium]|nr:hypothetical protein [Clostridia bacterium]